MKIIIAKFNSNCAETGAKINKGEKMLYNYDTKKCYCIASNNYKEYNTVDNALGMIEENENTYFDNFCYNNNF